MWPSVARVLTLGLHPDQIPSGVVIRCFSEECEGCQQFEPRRETFETRFRGKHVVDWNCDSNRMIRFALNCGATKLPCYIDNGHVIHP